MPTEFTIDAEVLPDPAAVFAKKLGARVERSHRERTIWLDSHDWLLHRAGLQLEQRTLARGTWLVLSEHAGEVVARQPAPRATVTLDTLPDGVIADRVRALLGIRALLPRVTTTAPVQVLAVLDKREKTVARAVLEGPTEVTGGERIAQRVRVETLRGYPKDGKALVRGLRALKGVRSAASRFETVCAAADLDPAGHRSKPDLHFAADQPAGEAFADTFAQLLAILRDNVDGTLRQLDTEFLHDLRITVRRSRAVVKFAAGVLPDDVVAAYAAELKWLGDQTSASRDLDVYLLGYDDLAGRVADPDSLAPFHAQLVKEHRRAHAALNRALRSDRFADLLAGWERDLCTPHAEDGAARPVGEVAAERLAKAWKRVLKRGRAITEESPPDDLHDLRKRCKELRYLFELFGSLLDPDTLRDLVKELKRLQDNLGDFQDFESQRFFVLEHAEGLARSGAPAAALMSMGRLEQQLEAAQDGARAEFAERWAGFDRPRNLRLYDTLGGDR